MNLVEHAAFGDLHRTFGVRPTWALANEVKVLCRKLIVEYILGCY